MRRPRHSIRQIPTEILYSEVIYNSNRTVKILTKTVEPVRETQRSKRPRYTRIERKIAYTDERNIIPTENDYHAIDSTGKMMYTLLFIAEQQGKPPG